METKKGTLAAGRLFGHFSTIYLQFFKDLYRSYIYPKNYSNGPSGKPSPVVSLNQSNRLLFASLKLVIKEQKKKKKT
jgi:hypothetical protein